MGCAASKGGGEPHHRNEQDTGIIRNVSHTHRNVSAAASVGGGSGTPRGKIKIAMRKPLMESVEDLHCPICCRSLHASLSRALSVCPQLTNLSRRSLHVPVSLPCGHAYCRTCVTAFLESTKPERRCAMCRAELLKVFDVRYGVLSALKCLALN